MQHTGYLIAVEAGLLLGLLVAAAWALFVRHPNRSRRAFAKAARALGGRIDPASECSKYPAVLAEIDGLLVRAIAWPLEHGDTPDEHPPYLEVCIPADGIASPVRVVRRAAAGHILPLLCVRRGEIWTESEGTRAVSISSTRPSLWVAQLFDAHPNWVLLEIDRGRLRVVTSDPGEIGYGAEAVAEAVRDFAAAVPAIAAAAGLPSRSRADERSCN